MVDWYSLKGISPQANAAQSAQLQAIQTAVAGELDAKQARLQALGYIVPKVVEVGGQLLDRRSKRKAQEAEMAGTDQLLSRTADLMLGDQVEGYDPNAAPLELQSQPLDELNYQKKPDGSFALGAEQQAVPPVNPQANRIREAYKSVSRAGLTGREALDAAFKIAGLTEYTPEGMNNIYTAKNTKSEYLSKEGLENEGIKSRRNVDRDLDLSKTRADIANTYDTMNKRGKDGGGASSGLSKKTINDLQTKVIGGASKAKEADYFLGEIAYFKDKYGFAGKLGGVASGRFLSQSPDDATRFNRFVVNMKNAGLREMVAAQGRGATEAESKAAQKRYGDILWQGWGTAEENLRGVKQEAVRDIELGQTFLSGESDLLTYKADVSGRVIPKSSNGAPANKAKPRRPLMTEAEKKMLTD